MKEGMVRLVVKARKIPGNSAENWSSFITMWDDPDKTKYVNC